MYAGYVAQAYDIDKELIYTTNYSTVEIGESLEVLYHYHYDLISEMTFFGV